jgi:hypothetical protein
MKLTEEHRHGSGDMGNRHAEHHCQAEACTSEVKHGHKTSYVCPACPKFDSHTGKPVPMYIHKDCWEAHHKAIGVVPVEVEARSAGLGPL